MHPFKAYGKVDPTDQSRLVAQRKTRRRIIVISISFIVLVAIIASVAVGVVRSNDKNNNGSKEFQTTSKSLKAVCDTTRYPDTCLSSISSYPGASQAGPQELAHIAVLVTMEKANNAFALVSDLAKQSKDPKQISALQDCVQMMDVTIDQLNSSSAEVKSFDVNSLVDPSGDVQTWLSASLANLDTCLDGLEDTAPNEAKYQVESICHNLTQLVSNSLAIVKTISDLLSRLKITLPPARRLLSEEDRRLLQEEVKPDLTVAADGSGNYTTIQAAVDAAPQKSKKRFIIKVKRGIYEEYVEVDKTKTMIMVIGDGMNNTIVTGDKNFIDGTRTFHSATFIAVGKGFIAKDIQFRNTAGPEKQQAVALRVGSDQSIFINCNISAYQDTLYAHSLRQFYRDSWISGTVDFIFGDAAMVLQNCSIVARVPSAQQMNTITAQGRTDPNENTGISIQNCNITGESSLMAKKAAFPSYLGRPWKEYSRTVIMLSYMDDIIYPAGWLEWNTSGFALNTLYYGEYKNSGPGANTTNRVNWPGYKVITSKKEAQKFTIGKLIGTSWLKSSGTTYSDGLSE